MKTVLNRLAPFVALLLVAMFLLAACGDEAPPRVPAVVTYSPGGDFSTNFNYEDPRRQVKCSIIFEVVDEKAIEELETHNFRIRNSVIAVLSTLTMEECTTHRDLDDISARIVEKVNLDLNASFDLIVGAYFLDFVVI